MDESFYDKTSQTQDSNYEHSLRPPAFSEFHGQDKIKERLMLMVEAAQQRDDVLEHVLLSGPPGLGKTTLANIIAGAAGTQLHTTSGPQIEKAGDLAGVLTNVQKGDILFIDEIHPLMGAGSSGDQPQDAANELKAALARGAFPCIGSTTLDEYKKFIEADAALERRFVRILIEEPTEKETV